MHTIISLPLSALFVFLAGFNLWNMLTGRGTSAQSGRLSTRVHRAVGYGFIALFVIFCYYMLLRLKASSDELSPRLALHMAMALLLAPLLLIKVLVARYQKAARGLLMALGIGISAIAFTLVALNVSIHYLRIASTHKVPVGTSATFVLVVLTAAALAFFAKSKQPKLKSDAAILSADKPAGQERELRSRDEALNLVLARIEPQTPDAKTLRFLLPRGQQIAARPGQFLTFEWMIDGKPVTRSYSICSSPHQGSFIEITPKRVENGYVSQFLNDRAKLGLTVRARGPYGKFCFDEKQHHRIVLIAGGSGITPMLAMLRYIDDLCIPVDVFLIYCVRTEEDVLFKNELALLQGRLSKFRCVLVLSRPSSDWTGWTGRLRREILEREVKKPRESTFFLCGPPAFMELGRALLKQMAVDPYRILQESFGGAIPGERQPPAAASVGPLEIRFSRSAVACHISADETLLESSEKNGVLIPWGCRQGICGTCKTKLLSGKVRMETEEALNDELRSQGFILPCVGRPLGDITLDA